MSNTRVKFGSPLPTFNQLKKEIPLSESLKEQILRQRREVEDVLDGKDIRKILIIGPCSIHNVKEALEYAKLLADWASRHPEVIVLMRVCCDKPRTKKDWRGLFNDPKLDGSHDLALGLRMSRKLMVDIATLGLGIATEALSPNNFHVISDIVVYAWVGARTGNSPDIREMTSGLSMPVGIKNPNDSTNLSNAIHAIDFARHPSVFSNPNDDGVMSIVETSGNQYSHMILRGNSSGPNYDIINQEGVVSAMKKANLNPRFIVDTSHGNCNKQYEKQKDVLAELALVHNQYLVGIMVESYLEADKQDSSKLGTPEGPTSLKPNQSVTDGCLSWKETEVALDRFIVECKEAA
ncbi:MAG: 3-deoxy-7-phosphoheptulonate synthase [bacterium]